MQKFSTPRHIWRAVYPILLFFFIPFLIVFIIEFMFGAMYNEYALLWLYENIMWLQLISSLASFAVLLPIWYFAKSKPLAYNGGKLSIKTVLLIIGAGIGANCIVSTVIGMFNLPEIFTDYNEVEALLSSGTLLSQILAVGLVGPVAEEICVRGIVQKRLNEWIPTRYAVFFSALVFGVMHMNVLQGSYAFVFGILLSLIYLKFRTLWAPIIGHIAVNMSSTLIGAAYENIPGGIPVWFDVAAMVAMVLTGFFCSLAIKRLPDNLPGEEEIEDEKVKRIGELFKIDSSNREDVTEFIKEHWFSTEILLRGKIIDMTKVDGFVLFGKEINRRKNINGLITYMINDESGYTGGRVCEIISLNSMLSGRGIGFFLMDRVRELAVEAGCTRLRLLTTNDNINAIEFYQKYGMELTTVNFGAVDREREWRPEIPPVAGNGIPIKHEIEFAMELQKSYHNYETKHKEELQCQQS